MTSTNGTLPERQAWMEEPSVDLLRPKRKAKPKTEAKPKPVNLGKTRKARKQVLLWAHRYTAVSVVVSSMLNGYAAVHHTTESGLGVQVAASLVSGLVPVLVWGLAQMGGWLVRAGQTRLAWAAGSVGIGMLLLSVVHVSEAIALLTGQHIILAVLLALVLAVLVTVAFTSFGVFRIDGMVNTP